MQSNMNETTSRPSQSTFVPTLADHCLYTLINSRNDVFDMECYEDFCQLPRHVRYALCVDSLQEGRFDPPVAIREYDITIYERIQTGMTTLVIRPNWYVHHRTPLEFTQNWFNWVRKRLTSMYYDYGDDRYYHRHKLEITVSFAFFTYLKYRMRSLHLTTNVNTVDVFYGLAKELPDVYDFAGDFFKLLRSGDVELNPGPPVLSTPFSQYRNNDPRAVRVEEKLQRQREKISTVLAAIRRDIKAESRGIHCQIFDPIRNWLHMPSNMNQQADRLLNFFESQLPSLQVQMSQVLLTVTDKWAEMQDSTAKLILIVLLVYWLMQSEHNKTAILVILAACASYFGLPEKISKIIRAISTELRREREPRIVQQGVLENILYSSWFGYCGQLIFACLAFVGIGKIPGKQDWDNYILRLDRIPKALEGATKVSEYCSQYFNLAVDQLKKLILNKTEAELGHVRTLYAEINDWAADVRKYCDLQERSKIDTSPETAQYVEQLWIRGLRYSSERIPDKHMSNLVRTTLFPAEQLYKYVSRSPTRGAGTRMRAVNIWLAGESGVGKSMMVYPLCIDLLREMGADMTNFHNSVYPRQVETEFWDGYHNQKIVVYDDAFQMRDDRTKPNPELHEVIRGCNTFPQHIHMAAIDDKNTFNVAEVNIYTTNKMNVEIASLTHPDAFYTRMCDYAYRVQPKLEFAIEYDDGGEMKRRLNKERLGDVIDLSVYEFQRVRRNFGHDRVNHPWLDIDRPVDYETLKNTVCTAWRTEKARFHNEKRWLSEYATRAQVADDDTLPAKEPGTMSAFSMNEEQRKKISPETWDRLFNADIKRMLADGESMQYIEYQFAGDNELYVRYLEFLDRQKIDATNQSMWRKFCLRIDAARSTVGQFISDLCDKAEEILKKNPFITVLSLVGLALTAFGIYELFQYYNAPVEEPEPTRFVEVSNSGDPKTTKVAKTVRVEGGTSRGLESQKIQDEPCVIERVTVADELEQRASTQGCNDEAAHSLVIDMLRKNTFRLSYMKTTEDGEKRIDVGNCTFVSGYNFVIPYHFLRTFFARGLAPTTEILFSQDGLEDINRLPLSHFYDVVDGEFQLSSRCYNPQFTNGDFRDIVFVNCHSFIDLKRNMRKHFITKEDQEKLSRGFVAGAMATFHRSTDKRLARAYQWLSRIQSHDKPIEIFYPQGSGEGSYLQRESYRYEAPTQVGDCGALIGVYNSRVTRKLIGMHIAGSEASSVGYATPITQELIDEAIEALKAQDRLNIQSYYEISPNVDSSRDPKMPDGLFVPIGKADKKVNGASKTAIRESVLHGKITEPTTKPALLRPKMIDGEMVDPLLKALKKCGVQTAIIDKNDLKAAAQNVSQIVMTQHNASVDRKKYQRVLSYEEAIRGTLDDQFMKSICRSTSPGYPYMLNNKGTPGKKRWMGKDEEFDFESMEAQQLRADVEELIEDCAEDVIRNVFWVDTKKDERRENAKVDIGKTRSFAAGPQHFVVAFRKYYLPFAAWLMHNRIDNEIAVGTNPFSIDWEQLTKRLRSKGKKIVAGDFGNFDGSLVAQILWAIYWEIFRPWFETFLDPNTEEGKRELKITQNLWTHIVHSVHIFDDNVYMWTHSQPSGNPFTALLNCLYNMIIMRLSWIGIMKENAPHLQTMASFCEHVAMVAYGDDNEVNIADAVIDLYNQETISAKMTDMKHEYTDETKSGAMVKHRSLEETHFLKRGFRFEKEVARTVAPLRKDVIYEMLNWTRINNSVDPNVITMDNIDCAFREIILHGREAYTELYTNVMKHADLLPRVPQILTYEEYMHDFKNQNHDLYNYYDKMSVSNVLTSHPLVEPAH